MVADDPNDLQGNIFSETKKGNTAVSEALKATSADFNAYTLNMGAYAAKFEEVIGGLVGALNPLDYKPLLQWKITPIRYRGLLGCPKKESTNLKQ